MNHFPSKLNRGLLALFTALFLSLVVASAQVCDGLPATPDNTVTSTQDRDHMMCELGLTFPILPVRQGTDWPWNDPTAPTNAWPKALTNPSGNWTDAQGHTIVRTAWGNWHIAPPLYDIELLEMKDGTPELKAGSCKCLILVGPNGLEPSTSSVSRMASAIGLSMKSTT